MMELDARFKAVEEVAETVEVALDDTKGVEEVL